MKSKPWRIIRPCFFHACVIPAQPVLKPIHRRRDILPELMRILRDYAYTNSW